MMFSWSASERILISRMRSSLTSRAWARVTAFSASRRWLASSWTSETKECAPTPMVRMRQKKKDLGEDGGGGVSMGGGGGCFLEDCSSMSLYLSAQRGMGRPLPREPSHYLCITFKIQGGRESQGWYEVWNILILECLCGCGNVQFGPWMLFILISLGRTMDPLVDLPTQSALTFPSGLTIPDCESPSESAQRFQQTLLFVRSLLGGWGMSFGALSFSPENECTLQCLMELAEQRRRELQLRSRSKEELSAMQFERDKYHSFLEQARRALEEHAKRIGRLENENAELKAQLKKVETAGKKQREEERKVSGGLRAKNQHMLHELKKREQEMARLKDQLKKSEKVVFKNSFEVFHPIKNSVLPHQIPLGASNSGTNHSDERFAFLLERNQRELAMALQENNLLKEKIGDVRQSLQEFRRWVDVEVFGEEQTHNPPYPLEHIMFGKDNLARQLDGLLQSIKDGIVQLREICRGKTPPKRKEDADMMNFKRKISHREEPKTQKAVRCSPAKPSQQNKQKTAKITLITRNKPQPAHNENQTPRSSQQLPTKQLRSEPNSKLPHRQMKVSLTDLKKMSHNKTASLLCTPRAKHEALTERLSDEISEISSHDLSIVSHLSIEQVGKGGHGWQELYQEDE